MNHALPDLEAPATADPASAADVADFFLAHAARRGQEICNLKLQKLLYYAQGWHLGLFGRPLFPEKFQAWSSGPVIPELYWRWKEFGIGAVPAAACVRAFPPATAEFLNEVTDAYMPFDVWELHWKTRAETPWLAARRGRTDGPGEEEISEAVMSRYFREHAVDL